MLDIPFFFLFFTMGDGVCNLEWLKEEMGNNLCSLKRCRRLIGKASKSIHACNDYQGEPQVSSYLRVKLLNLLNQLKARIKANRKEIYKFLLWEVCILNMQTQRPTSCKLVQWITISVVETENAKNKQNIQSPKREEKGEMWRRITEVNSSIIP